MFDRAGRFAGRLEDHGQIVVRGRAALVDRERAQQRLLRLLGPPRRFFRERQIDQRIHVSRFLRKHGAELSGGGVEVALIQERDTKIVSRPEVARVDVQRALELRNRFIEHALRLIEQPEVIARLRVHRIALQQRAIVNQRVVEVTRTLIVKRELEVVDSACRRSVRRSGIRDVLWRRGACASCTRGGPGGRRYRWRW
jgi:hypothetical protein